MDISDEVRLLSYIASHDPAGIYSRQDRIIVNRLIRMRAVKVMETQRDIPTKVSITSLGQWMIEQAKRQSDRK